jgi:hypothetical protein
MWPQPDLEKRQENSNEVGSVNSQRDGGSWSKNGHNKPPIRNVVIDVIMLETEK